MNEQNGFMPPRSIIEGMKSLAGLLATLVGLGIMLVGLKYCVDILALIFGILKEPATMEAFVGRLAETIGGQNLDMTIDHKNIPVARIFALVFYCVGGLILAALSMALMRTGGAIVARTAGDREAIKQILQYAFGNILKSQKNIPTAEDRKEGS
jgi:H+/Cl- antiporter ClcA